MNAKSKPGNPWGYRCPECGRDDEIHVTATLWARLGPEGSTLDLFEMEQHEWADDSPARCDSCEFEAPLPSFAPTERSPS